MNQLSRRGFLAGGLAGLFLGSGKLFAAPAGMFSKGKPNLKLGVVSDVHIRALKGREGWEKNCAVWKQALEFFREREVDGVVVAGDIADTGLVPQLEAFMSIWNEVFPDSRGKNGEAVAKLFVTGNHDWQGSRYGKWPREQFKTDEEFNAAVLRTDYAGNWERITGEKYASVWMKTVKGYHFVGAHWNTGFCTGKGEKFNQDIAKFYEQHAQELAGTKPFFHIQHPHPKSTVCGEGIWGQDEGMSSTALSKFPNAISFSGHSHCTLVDDRCIWQGAFTSVGTASLRYTGAPFFPEFENYENGWGSRKTMAVIEDVAQQGMVVSVYDDRVVFARHDFSRKAASLGDDWVMPLNGEKPFDFAAAAKRMGAPAFAPGAKVVVVEGKFKGQGKKAKDGWVVKFPCANASKSARGVRFAVTGVAGEVKKTRWVIAADAHHAPNGKTKNFCNFPKSDFPKGTPKFTVEPVSSYLVRGPAIGE